ncbi:MAG: hypothetical protein ACLVJX_11060, partial [Merdibacter sp.]
GNANRNYNYENITKAHGEQYVGKNLKALSTKNNNGSSNEIMTLMKFPIPDAAEIEEKQLDHFELVFHIFKNADYNTGDQTYRFYYSRIQTERDCNRWNNKPEDVTCDFSNAVDFDIKQGDEYETKPDAKRDPYGYHGDGEALSDRESGRSRCHGSHQQHEHLADPGSFSAMRLRMKTGSRRIVASHEGITLEQLNQLTRNASRWMLHSMKKTAGGVWNS